MTLFQNPYFNKSGTLVVVGQIGPLMNLYEQNGINGQGGQNFFHLLYVNIV